MATFKIIKNGNTYNINKSTIINVNDKPVYIIKVKKGTNPADIVWKVILNPIEIISFLPDTRKLTWTSAEDQGRPDTIYYEVNDIKDNKYIGTTTNTTMITIPKSILGGNTIQIKATSPYLEGQERSANYILPKVKLDMPINLQVVNTTVSWDSVENASYYIIYASGRSIKANTNSRDLQSDLLGGTFTITVQAKVTENDEHWLDSDISTESVEVTIREQLDMPTGVNLSDDMIAWDPVPNATYYNYILNNEPQKDTNYNYVFLNNPGEYTITVQACDGQYYTPSKWTDPQTFDYFKQLDTPDISANYARITWPAIPHALKYRVSLDDANEFITVSTNSVDIWEKSTYNIYHTAGVHNVSVKVRANTNGHWTQSAESDEVNTSYTVLNKPTNIRFNTSTKDIYWDSVPNAATYEVYVDGELYNTTTKTHITSGPIGGGVYTIGVIARSNVNGYYPSEMATNTITIGEQLPEPTIISVDSGLLKFSAPKCEYVRCKIYGITDTSFHTTINLNWELEQYDLIPVIRNAGGTSGMYECNLEAIGNGTTTLDSGETTFTQFYATITQQKWVKLRVDVNMDMADTIMNVYIDSCSSDCTLNKFEFDADGMGNFSITPPRGQKVSFNESKNIYTSTFNVGVVDGIIMVWYNNTYVGDVEFSLTNDEGNSAILTVGNQSISTATGSGQIFHTINFT